MMRIVLSAAYHLIQPITTLYDAIYDERSRSGGSQDELLAASGVAVQEIDNIETGGAFLAASDEWRHPGYCRALRRGRLPQPQNSLLVTRAIFLGFLTGRGVSVLCRILPNAI